MRLYDPSEIDWKKSFPAGFGDAIVYICGGRILEVEGRDRLQASLRTDVILDLHQSGIPLSIRPYAEYDDYEDCDESLPSVSFHADIVVEHRLDINRYIIDYNISVQAHVDMYSHDCSPIIHDQSVSLWQWGANWQRQRYLDAPTIEPRILHTAVADFARIWHSEDEQNEHRNTSVGKCG